MIRFLESPATGPKMCKSYSARLPSDEVDHLWADPMQRESAEQRGSLAHDSHGDMVTRCDEANRRQF